jgi:ketosteroid isomerase-like protein
MPEESTTPDLVELMRQSVEAFNRGEVDTTMSLFASDAVYVTERFGRFEGRPAIRGYFEDWLGSFDDFVFELAEVHDLGNGVVFCAQVQTGCLVGSSAEVHLRNAAVHTFVEGLIVRSTTHMDIDEARAVAERLAEERG